MELVTYKIPCIWQMSGVMYIQAESLDQALSKAYEDEPLPEGEYLTDSFFVDTENAEYQELLEKKEEPCNK